MYQSGHQSDGQTRKRKPRKQEEPWLKQQCLELVLAVKNFECIWNHTLEAYKDREQREMAWETIARDFGRSKEDCKNKWACIRVNYKTTLSKMKNTKSGQEVIKMPDPYSAMGFLEPMLYIQPVKRVSNLSFSRWHHQKQKHQPRTIKMEPPDENEATEDIFSFVNCAQPRTPSPTCSSSSLNSAVLAQPQPQQSSHIRNNNAADNAAAPPQTKDRIACFADWMATKLRALNPLILSTAELRITQLLYKLELEQSSFKDQNTDTDTDIIQ